MTPRNHHLPDTWGWRMCEVTEIFRAHTGPLQGQITRHSEGEVDAKSTPYQEATYKWFLLEKGKHVFSKGLSLALSTTLHARPRPCSGAAAEHKTDCRDFCVLILFKHIFPSLFLPYLVILLLFLFIFGLGFLFWYFRDGKRKKIKLGG